MELTREAAAQAKEALDPRGLALRTLLEARPGGLAFLASLPEPRTPAFGGRFASASRALGRAPLLLDARDRAELARAGVTSRLDAWATDDLGRVVMLLEATGGRSGADVASLVVDLFQAGELRERQAILRALPLLPHPAHLVPCAIDACRTHVQPVFEAIACDNPLPADHFPDAAFNQMVLKCLFTGAPLARVVGLARRRTSELSRMAHAYASERRAAGRPVPEDMALIDRAYEGSFA